MEETIPCADNIEALASDVDIFLKGGITSSVVLSGGKVIPSYRKYVIEDLTRTGNNIQARTYFVDDIISYNREIYICKRDNTISNVLATLNPLNWQKVGNFEVVSGTGFDAYLSYDMKDRKILASANIASVTISNVDSDTFTVKLTKPVPRGINKLGVIISTDVSNSNNLNLFQSQIQNTTNKDDSYIGTQKKNVQYARGGALPLAEMFPVGKIITNSGNDYTIKIQQGIKYFSSSITQRPPYTAPQSINNYEYLNSGSRGVFKPIVNMLFFILP